MGSTKLNNKAVNITCEQINAPLYSLRYMNDDYGTIAYSINRNELKYELSDSRLCNNCIYFLIGTTGTEQMVYVGQAGKRDIGTSVIARLREHDKNTKEAYNGVWKVALVFTNKEDTWGADTLKALEHAFYKLIPEHKRLNSAIPNSGCADMGGYEDKIKQIQNYIRAMGYSIFGDNGDTDTIQIELIEGTKVEDLHCWKSSMPEVVTPSSVVKAMVDMLPAGVWNDRTVFMDMACKGGEYLREVYDRLMNSEVMQVKYRDKFERHNHILTKQIYGIALSEISMERTRNKLMGFDGNIRIIPNYIRRLKSISKIKDKAERDEAYRTLLREGFNKDMEVDVVIGNPPYNDITSGGSETAKRGMPVYVEFITAAQSYSKIVSMITPVRWYTQSEAVYDKVRAEMLNGQLEKIVDFKDAEECFRDVSIAGGVSYWLWIKGRSGVTEMSTGVDNWFADLRGLEILLRDKQAYSIARKVKTYCEHTRTFDSVVMGTDAFGVRRERLGQCIKDDEHTVALLHSSSFDRRYEMGNIEYINRGIVYKNAEYIDSYKVITEYMNGSGDKVLNSINILGQGEICDLSYIVIAIVNDKSLAEKIAAYFKTKFVRFLIKATLVNTTVTKGNYILVPMQDFSNNSGIDWSTDIARQLYSRYGLNDEEITYIEDIVADM